MNLTPPELESLAAILIRQLTANLEGKAIASIKAGQLIIPVWLDAIHQQLASGLAVASIAFIAIKHCVTRILVEQNEL